MCYKRQVLELFTKTVNSQTFCDGSIDLKRLSRNAPGLVRPHHAQRAHIVQAISQFDENHAHIPCHRQDHFSKTGGNRLFPGAEIKMSQLGHTIDQLGNLIIKNFLDFSLRCRRIFDDIMHHRRHQALIVEPHSCQNISDGNRVIDIGLARHAFLIDVRISTEEIGAIDLTNLFGRQVGLQVGEQIAHQKTRLIAVFFS